MRVHALQQDIYDNETLRGITWIIIGYVRKYFRQSLMPSAFTENRMERKIALPTSILGFMVNKPIISMLIRVSNILKKW